MKETNNTSNNKHTRKKTKVFLTGATGVMGFQTLKEFMKYPEDYEIRVLSRDSKKNRNKLQPYMENYGVTVVWGDLRNQQDVESAMGDSEYVLHIGGMVSPLADHFPELTMDVNINGAKNIVRAIKKRKDRDNVKLVYIGSVAQTAHRHEPHHWGRTGDPIMAALYDAYAVSKIKAELIVAESGLRHWVSLRQSGILHPGLIFKGSDPISFHVPLRGVLEWATVEDSARLMVGICSRPLGDNFWNKFYNIGSGTSFRLSNYEFEKLLLKSLGCPPPEKCFDTSWFATRNFHGEWYLDSDLLNSLIPFREEITAEEYFNRMAKSMPWWMKLTPLAPAFLIKCGMKFVARSKKLGTLNWLANKDNEARINAFFGGREEQKNIPGWKDFDLSRPSEKGLPLNYGYNYENLTEQPGLKETMEAASYRGLEYIGKSDSDDKNIIDIPLLWKCKHCGTQFEMRPRTMLLGGHWCPDCECEPLNYAKIAETNPFVAQVWNDSHNYNHNDSH
ncbi:MAG: NAD-dependent epimerase/dehydratase family protein [Bacteroidales bacterium]|nr:NAD-dependent epimerase/dehydratase family protein [Bacteroidales bacterium]